MTTVSLYAGISDDFILKAGGKTLAIEVTRNFEREIGHRPVENEVASWTNSLASVARTLKKANLRSQGVMVEMTLPRTSSRLDCLIAGRDVNGLDQAVIVELKQWGEARACDRGEMVEAVIGGSWAQTSHPSDQARGYHFFLSDLGTVFSDETVSLSSCAWLHNMPRAKSKPLFAGEFTTLVEQTPCFTRDDEVAFQSFLIERVGAGGGKEVLQKIKSSRWEPSKKLLEHVAEMINGEPIYSLLDEQRVAFLKVIDSVRRNGLGQKKSVFIIRGGPGTGKSVIALNLLADLAREGKKVEYVTGSRSFTETLKKKLGRRASVQFKYTHNYSQERSECLDALVIDEAHRIRLTSNTWRTPKIKRSDRPQIEELISVARTVAFFVDEKQVVRPEECGSTALILAASKKLGAVVEQIDLEAQFRCGGSDKYVNWVADLLQMSGVKAVEAWDSNSEFDLKIVETPLELEKMVRQRDAEGVSARMSAGFCWAWSDPLPDVTLIPDVRIGNWEMPWDAKPGAKKLAKEIPPASLWATDPRGINQIGCVYTAQGFEYDFAAVIWGADLVIRDGTWVGQPTESRDSGLKRNLKKGDVDFVDLVKNTYRVLLTRGMRGCWIYFVDEETREFVKRRIANH